MKQVFYFLLICFSSVVSQKIKKRLTGSKQTYVFQSADYPAFTTYDESARWILTTSENLPLRIICDADLVGNCKRAFIRIYGEKICDSGKHERIIAASRVVVRYENINNLEGSKFSCSVSLVTGEDTTTSVPPVATGPATTVAPPPPGTCSCGKKYTMHKIVGGQDASANEYPWQASLLIRIRNDFYSCGGSLINNKWVLTVAHCLTGALEVKITLGNHHYDDDDPTQVTYYAVSIISHPSYSRRTSNNDIGLLELPNALTFSEENWKIAPVCLPFSSSSSSISGGETSTVTGWGTTSSGGTQSNVLQEVDVPLITTEQCRSNTYGYGNKITDNMICAGEEGKDSCHGDSGGPLIWDPTSAGIYFQVGIVSWGYGCAGEFYPGVYTKVEKYLDWIEGEITGTLCKP